MKTKFNQSNLKLAIVSAIMACSAGLSASSYAATETATMTVSSSVLTACTMSTGDLTFGAYDPITQANVDGTATITSTCTLGGGAIITLGQGNNADTGSTDEDPLRQMADGTNRLKYRLYVHLITVLSHSSETALLCFISCCSLTQTSQEISLQQNRRVARILS